MTPSISRRSSSSPTTWRSGATGAGVLRGLASCGIPSLVVLALWAINGAPFHFVKGFDRGEGSFGEGRGDEAHCDGDGDGVADRPGRFDGAFFVYDGAGGRGEHASTPPSARDRGRSGRLVSYRMNHLVVAAC